MPKEKYSSEYKVRTVLEGLKSSDGISAFCRRQGISDTQFYNWQKQLLNNADAVFHKTSKSAEAKIQRLENDLQRKDHIIAVVTEEALELKKKTYKITRYKRLSLEAKLDLLNMLERYIKYGWSKQAICNKWGISVQVFYSFNYDRPKSTNGRRIQANRIREEEKQKVAKYALKHTNLNHRELTYRMIDEDIAYMSTSSVYRILKENNLIQHRKHNNHPNKWDPHGELFKPDEVWQTDLMNINYKHRDYYMLTYLDVYSRFGVYQELCLTMTGDSIREATSRALDLTGKNPLAIQSDNGSCYVSHEYKSFLSNLEIEHRRIHPHCPNENAEIERYHRTVRELIDPQDAENFNALNELIKEQFHYYNYKRYHSAIGFITPYQKYTGQAEKIFKTRKLKLEKAKQKRIQLNLEKIETENEQAKIKDAA